MDLKLRPSIDLGSSHEKPFPCSIKIASRKIPKDHRCRSQGSTGLALLLVAASMLAMEPGRAQDQAEASQSVHALANPDTGTEVSPHYRLPISNNHSLYFLPGSADLSESAKSNIAATAAHLKAIPALFASLVAYTDAWEDHEYGEELRRTRAVTVSDALVALGVLRHRISIRTGKDQEQSMAPCISEYCRQSYRRVRVEVSRHPFN